MLQHGIHRADRGVRLDLVDIGDHRLLRCQRDFTETNPDAFITLMDTLGKNTTMIYDAALLGYAFACKGCRDQGFDWQTFVSRADIVAALHALWIAQAQADVPKPTTTRLMMKVDPTASAL